MNSVTLQDVRIYIYRNLLHFYTLTTKDQKENLRNNPIFHCIKKTKISRNKPYLGRVDGRTPKAHRPSPVWPGRGSPSRLPGPLGQAGLQRGVWWGGGGGPLPSSSCSSTRWRRRTATLMDQGCARNRDRSGRGGVVGRLGFPPW